jgi:hypothetical protein
MCSIASVHLAQGLPISAEMSGHPSLAKYLEAGYQIITL